MAILLNTQLPGGETLGYHRVVKAEADFESGQLTAIVQSWLTRAEFMAGARAANTSVELNFADFPNVETALVTKPDCPFSGGAVVADSVTSLDFAKAAKTAEINAARLKANRTTFPFQGQQIACDELSRSDIDGVNGYVALTGSMPPDFPGVWKSVSNAYVAIPNVGTWTAFYGAMVAQGSANFMYSQALKQMLDVATNVEDVNAIFWGMPLPE